MIEKVNQKYGILIIAQGKERYINMSRQIALSLILSNPHIPRTLVTDCTASDLKNYYDTIIPIDETLGVGYVQKLHMHKYSPYQKTMFIDVDCLVIQNIDWLFQRFNHHPVSVIGKKITSGSLLGTTLEKLNAAIGITYLPVFNGGVYYFEKGPISDHVFDDANRIFKERYDELNLWKFSNQPGDEPVMSIAMALHNMQPIDDEKKGMYTPVGQQGIFKIEALHGFCEFYKYGEKVMPVIMHFGGGYPEAFHYRRETLKIKLAYYYKLPKKIVSVFVNTIYNPAYITYVLGYRLLKLIFKGERFKISPLMPMFRFE